MSHRGKGERGREREREGERREREGGRKGERRGERGRGGGRKERREGEGKEKGEGERERGGREWDRERRRGGGSTYSPWIGALLGLTSVMFWIWVSWSSQSLLVFQLSPAGGETVQSSSCLDVYRREVTLSHLQRNEACLYVLNNAHHNMYLSTSNTCECNIMAYS